MVIQQVWKCLSTISEFKTFLLQYHQMLEVKYSGFQDFAITGMNAQSSKFCNIRRSLKFFQFTADFLQIRAETCGVTSSNTAKALFHTERIESQYLLYVSSLLGDYKIIKVQFCHFRNKRLKSKYHRFLIKKKGAIQTRAILVATIAKKTLKSGLYTFFCPTTKWNPFLAN